ncbi:MAG: hypothetical protein V1802_01845 [Candidatus Aenigmatarchaeota archaeon]
MNLYRALKPQDWQTVSSLDGMIAYGCVLYFIDCLFGLVITIVGKVDGVIN